MSRTFLLILSCLVLGRNSLAQDPLSVSSALKQKQKEKSQFIEGLITKVYHCPPCPKGAQCKPCDGEHILFKDTKSSEVLKAYVSYGNTFYQKAKEGETVKVHVLWRQVHKDGSGEGEFYLIPEEYPGASYYEELSKKCHNADSKSCCDGSYQRIFQRGVREAPSSGCPEGTQQDMLKCMDSFQWCY